MDSAVTVWLLHGMRITAPPQQRCGLFYFNRESGSPEEAEAFLFWLWSSSLLCSTGTMNKTSRAVRGGTLARGSAVQLQQENRGAPHQEKFAKSLPFDRKSCRGKIAGDWAQI